MKNRFRLALVCSLLSSASTDVFSQNTNSADIRGTVTDPSGAVVPGVAVTIKNEDTGVVRAFVSNNEGLYDTASILPGNYTVTFNKEGVQKVVRGPIALQVGVFTVNAALRSGRQRSQQLLNLLYLC